MIEFQSTHPRGVRREQFLNFLNAEAFQSTHPRGVRLGFSSLHFATEEISIHAPTWGATCVNVPISQEAIFQSTHPRGVRLCCCFFTNAKIHFNPRTHVGCDDRQVRRRLHVLYFNPRTHVGCDTYAATRSPTCPDFNPRTHVGCDEKAIITAAIFNISIHAPTWGATLAKAGG